MTEHGLLLRRVVTGGRLLDVRVAAGRVTAMGPELLRGRREQVVDARGAALLPGLHDHHTHLFALAAARASVPCGPPAVRDRDALRAALRAPTGTGWVRGVGYDEAVAGPLDRWALDDLLGDDGPPAHPPVRVQHRSGALWMLNSRAVQTLGVEHWSCPGVERDGDGRPTGRLWRADRELRAALAQAGAGTTPDLHEVGRRFARYGVTSLTDATPEPVGPLATACRAGLPQHVTALGSGPACQGVRLGARKIVVADSALPGLAELADSIRAARADGRAVAVHVVTREALLLALAALEEVGVRRGDRLEHAAVVPAEVIGHLARTGLAVVTQPSLVAQRGDDYLARSTPVDHPDLWRFASLRSAGVPVGCSSDAPYGDPDPWRSIRAARDRRTTSGQFLGVRERVTAMAALAGYLGRPDAPGGPHRTVSVGSVADLVLLDCSLPEMLRDPDADGVRLTLVAGRTAYDRDTELPASAGMPA